MAAKKTATKKTTGSGTAATRKATTAKSTATKAPAADATAKTKPATKAAAKKPLKLTDAQEKILRQIDAVGEAGYTPAQKTELRSIEKLRELKLVKRGAKDKVSGNTPYMATASGKKHIASQPAG